MAAVRRRVEPALLYVSVLLYPAITELNRTNNFRLNLSSFLTAFAWASKLLVSIGEQIATWRQFKSLCRMARLAKCRAALPQRRLRAKFRRDWRRKLWLRALT